MNKLKEIRQWPDKINIKRELLYSLTVVVFGLLFGCVAKATDSISLIGDIGTDLGVWVFIVSIIAAFSSRPRFAMINTPVFLLSMLTSYYLYGQLILGFFPKAYMMGWLVMALISPIGGLIVWFARGEKILSSICTALPASLLFACGYPAVYTHQPVMVLDLLFGAVLLLILPKTWKARAIAAGAAVILAFVMVQLRLISYLPW